MNVVWKLVVLCVFTEKGGRFQKLCLGNREKPYLSQWCWSWLKQVLFYFFKSPCYGIPSFYYIFKYCLNTSIAALCACLLSFATNLLDSKLVHFSLLTSRCQERAVWLWHVYRRTGVIPSSVCLLRMLGTSREREQLKQKLAYIYFCVWQLLRLKSIITYVCL